MSAQPWTSADGRVALHVGDSRDVLRGIADASVDAVVCDPPYELGFMGRKWDASGIAYDVDLWREVLRVMKPGAHLLAFGSTRTYHRMTCAIEDADFEIRDCIAWIYGSGFPKSLDVSKAIDKAAGHDRTDIYRVTAWVRAARDAARIGNRDIDEAFGFAGMAGHWTSAKSQPLVPTLEQVPLLLGVLGLTIDDVPDDIRLLLWDLNSRKGQPGENWWKREVTGQHKSAAPGRAWSANCGINANLIPKEQRDIPSTDDAKRWQGWGTALKPAHEPIVVARKPLEGTVASNVITHGTGGINVDACRVGSDRVVVNTWDDGAKPFGGGAGHAYTSRETVGRWPANVALDEEAAQGMGEPSRFFYTAKASTSEREQGLAHRAKRKVNDGREATADSPRLRGESMRGNTHPTVKPIDLMRWLCRLVTPPNGLILDPFAGSGSTLIAAHAEGFRALGVELDEEHASIARDRLGGHASLFVGLR